MKIPPLAKNTNRGFIYRTEGSLISTIVRGIMPHIALPRWLACGLTLVIAMLVPSPAIAQFAKPTLRVDDDTPIFSIAPDNRVAYVVRHMKNVSKSEVERDDLWVVALGGKKDRLLDSQKIVKGSKPVNCVIREIRWAPDSHHLIVGLSTNEVSDESVPGMPSQHTIAMDDSAHDVPIESALATAFSDASRATWLNDSATVVYLNGASPQSNGFVGRLTGISSIRPPHGKPSPLFDGHTFADVAWDSSGAGAIAIERGGALHPLGMELVWLTFAGEKVREITPLSDFAEQLTLSPSGKRVAFFSDVETIEVRDLALPAKAISMHIPPGTFQWAPGEQYLLLKRGDPAHATDIFWIHIPDGSMQPFLHDLVFASFQVSPDGSYLGLCNPGDTGFQLIPMPAPGT